MSSTKTYGIVAVVAVIVIVAAVWYMTQDGGEGEDVGDTYYIYLDGMGDANGWHVGKGETPYAGVSDALESDGIDYDIGEDGWISSVAGYAYDGTNGFGVFVYTSTDPANPYEGYFCAGPVISDVTGNIIYLSYGGYDANYNSILTPSSTEADVTSGGPFADPDYKPLSYDDTYYVYLDGMGDANGWYTGNGANGMEGVIDALASGNVQCQIGDDGWITSIAGFAYDGTNGFGVFVYTSSVLENPFEGYFGAGPTVSTVAGNIIYISYGGYDANYNSILTPSSTESDVMGTGPFATA